MTKGQPIEPSSTSENGAPMAAIRILDRAYRGFTAIAEKWYTRALFLMILFRVLTSGLGTMPREPYRLAALDPFHRVLAHPENYFQRSPLFPLIAHFTGLTSRFAFAGLSLGIIVVGLALYAYFTQRVNGKADGLILSGLVISHPVVIVMLSWLGTPDGLSFIFTALLLYSKSASVLFFACAFGAFNHPVLNFVAPILIALRIFSGEPDLRRQMMVPAAVGLLIGNTAVFGFLEIFEIQTYSRLDFLLSRSLLTWLKQNVYALPHTLYSLHQASWFALALCLAVGFKKNRAYYLLFISSLLFTYGVAFFSADTTRVFGLLAWGPALHCIGYTIRLIDAGGDGQSSQQFRQALMLVTLVGLVAPGYFMWTGELHLSGFNEFYWPILGWIRALVH